MIPSVSALLARRARRDPDLLAVVAEAERLSFRALQGRVNATARLLLDQGVARGDRIAVLARNSIAYIELYYAAASVGAILCGLNFRLAVAELVSIVQDCRPKMMAVDAEFASTGAALCEAVSATLFTIGRSGGTSDFAGARGRFSDSELDLSVDADEPLVLVYTSGTTGRAKGALLSHAQMYWASATQLEALDFRYRDVHFIASPLFHVGGLAFATLFVHLGATAAVLSQWDAKKVRSLIDREGIHHFFAVPAMLKTLLAQLPDAKNDLRSLRWIITGGAPIPPGLIEAFAAHGVRVLQSYGSTETAGPAACIDPDRYLAKVGSAGRPYFYADIQVVDAEGRTCAPGVVGDIEICAPHVFSGYWQNPQATAAAFRGRWLRTGDRGLLDDDGDLFVAGRAGEMIITGGENVYPAEIELVLESHPKVSEVVVLGRPDPDWGEIICAVVVPRDRAAPSLDELQEYCRGKLARYKIPRSLELRHAPLPRNASGKVLRRAVTAAAGT